VKEELPVVTPAKVSKAVKLLEEIEKEAEISPLAEAKRLEIAANIKTTQKTLLELNEIYSNEKIKNPFNRWLEREHRYLKKVRRACARCMQKAIFL